MQRRILRVGGFVLQTVYSQWECVGGRAGEGPSGGGGEWPTSVSIPIGGQRGVGAVFPPHSIRPLGVQELGAR